MRALNAAPLVTATTRAPGRWRSAGSSAPVSAKWPRWFTPNCISKPSAVRRRGNAITPALATSTSTPAPSDTIRSANARTDANDARSSTSTRTVASGTSRSTS